MLKHFFDQLINKLEENEPSQLGEKKESNCKIKQQKHIHFTGNITVPPACAFIFNVCIWQENVL